MLFGMGTVFVFLTLLVFATTIMSKAVGLFAKDAATSTMLDASPSAHSASTHSDHSPSPQVVKAIEKAIAAHRDAK